MLLLIAGILLFLKLFGVLKIGWGLILLVALFPLIIAGIILVTGASLMGILTGIMAFIDGRDRKKRKKLR